MKEHTTQFKKWEKRKTWTYSIQNKIYNLLISMKKDG